jgi:predicted O-methyltransferase YrrM
MSVAGFLYNLLPGRIRPTLKKFYLTVHPNQRSALGYESSFVSAYFESEGEYRAYLAELDAPPVSNYRETMMAAYDRHVGDRTANRQKAIPGGLDETAATNLYALVRNLAPDIVLETGVHYGYSTAHILAALSQNGGGTLHSVDPAFDDSLPGETTSPGWLVPDDLHDYWNLHIGKSQRVLPTLLPELDRVDLFLHDSDHSAPCMMFEFELVYEWLADGGVLISDDIHWNDSFSTFAQARDGEVGRLSINTGYIWKSPPRP